MRSVPRRRSTPGVCCTRPRPERPSPTLIPCIRRQTLAKHLLVAKRQAIQISTRQLEGATILDLIGEITLFNSPEIRKAVLTLLREQRIPHLILNMRGVPYVDSSGVASLVEALKVAREIKSRLALYGLSKSAKTVLELTHLLKVFEVHQTEEEALQAQPPSNGASQIQR
jgi:anti-sigma B factor antagonist